MNELFHSNAREEETIGRVIPPGDANALAQTVVDLLKDNGLRNRLAKNGQAQVQEEYNLRHAACQYNRIYHELQGCHS
jgi:glycosyltransferase involved in cell wall biosynthesis